MLRRKLLRDLRRQRAQFAAIVLTVVLGVALFGATYEAYRSLNASYAQAFQRYRFANLTVDGGNVGQLARTVAATPGVAAVQPRTQGPVPLRIGAAKVLGRVVGMGATGMPSVDRVALRAGRALAAGDPSGVLVEEHTARHFQLVPGDRLLAAGRRLMVRGIAASPEYFWPALSAQDVLVPADEFAVLFAPEPLARRVTGTRAPNQLTVWFDGGRDDAALQRRVARAAYAAGAASVTTRAQQPSNSALQEDVKGFGELAVMFPLLFLAAAALASSVVLTRMVAAQRPIVGMLRAAGFPQRAVLRHYLGFGLVAGLGGGLLGALLGALMAGPLTHMYTRALSIPVSLTRFSPWTPLAGVAFGLLAGLLAAGAPARAAARVPPGEAMRRFSPPRRGRRSLAERLLPPLARLPARRKLVLRNVERSPRRALATMLGVVLALTLVLVSWGMIDTVQLAVQRQFGSIERQDAEVDVAGPLTPARLRAVRAVAGVARAEPAATQPVVISHGARRFATTLLALEHGTRMHGFQRAGDGPASLPADGLLTGASVRSALRIAPGARVQVRLPATGAAFATTVRGFLDEPLGTYAYATLPALRAAAGARAAAPGVALVRYRPGASRTQVRRALAALPGVVAVRDTRALREQFDGLLGFYYAFVGIMLAFGAAVAFALLYAVMTSNLAERSVELATLRAAGAGRRALAATITAENALVVLAAIPLGLLAGYEAARAFMASFNTDWYSFALHVRASTLALSALAIALVALLSQLPGLRAIRRLDVAQIVRERSL